MTELSDNNNIKLTDKTFIYQPSPSKTAPAKCLDHELPIILDTSPINTQEIPIASTEISPKIERELFKSILESALKDSPACHDTQNLYSDVHLKSPTLGVKIKDETLNEKAISDSDSTTSLLSRVKNPKKRRTSRVEYNPTNRSLSAKKDISFSNSKPKTNSTKKSLKSKDKDGNSNFFLAQQNSFLLASNSKESSKTKNKKNLPSQKLTPKDQHNRQNTLKHSQLSSEPNISNSFYPFFEKFDHFDAEVEDIYEHAVGETYSSCKICNSQSSQKFTVVDNDAFYKLNSNPSHTSDTSDIKPFDVVNPSLSPDSDLILKGNKQQNNTTGKRNLKVSTNDAFKYNQRTKNKPKKQASGYAKDDPSIGHISQSESNYDSSLFNTTDITSTPLSPSETKYEGIKLSESSSDDIINFNQQNFNQRTSARLRQIQNQKIFFPHSSEFSSTVQNPFIFDNRTQQNLVFSNSSNSPLTLRSTNNFLANGTLSPTSNFLMTNYPTRLPITNAAMTDPIILSAYEVATFRMKKVEEYFDVCETLYFGKQFNMRNLLSIDSSMIHSTIENNDKATKQNFQIGTTYNNDFEAFMHPSYILIRNLILSNNRSNSEDTRASPAYTANTSNKSQSKPSPTNPKKGNPTTLSKSNSVTNNLTPLELLTSPLRKPHVLDRWAPIEVCKFEAAICKYGKDFSLINRIIQTKSSKEIVDFYYLWKKSTRYFAWKKFRNLSETISSKDFD